MVPSRDSSSEEKAAIWRPGTKRQKTRKSPKNCLTPLEVCLGIFPISTHQPDTKWKKEITLPFPSLSLAEVLLPAHPAPALSWASPAHLSHTVSWEAVSVCVCGWFKLGSHTRTPCCQTWYGPGACVNRIARNKGSRLLGFESSVCYLQTTCFWQVM